jgi:hypothetical protein
MIARIESPLDLLSQPRNKKPSKKPRKNPSKNPGEDEKDPPPA